MKNTARIYEIRQQIERNDTQINHLLIAGTLDNNPFVEDRIRFHEDTIRSLSEELATLSA